MGRPSVKKERKLQIAQGMMKVMATKGYDGASMPEIAKAAGLGQGLIHYHFKSKQEILVAVLGEIVSHHVDALNERLATIGNDPENQLNAFIDFYLGLGSYSNPEALACWVIISAEAMKKKEIGLHYENAINGYVIKLSEIISSGISAGTFKCESPKAAAAAITAAIQGYFLLSATTSDQIPRGSAANCTKEMAKGLLKP